MLLEPLTLVSLSRVFEAVVCELRLRTIDSCRVEILCPWQNKRH